MGVACSMLLGCTFGAILKILSLQQVAQQEKELEALMASGRTPPSKEEGEEAPAAVEGEGAATGDATEDAAMEGEGDATGDATKKTGEDTPDVATDETSVEAANEAFRARIEKQVGTSSHRKCLLER